MRIRILIGTAYGATSPVQTLSSLFYVEATMPEGGELLLPSEHEERAVYVAEGVIRCGAECVEARRMVVFAPGSRSVLRAESPARVLLLGSAPMDGERHIWWNFVSSSKARIEQAKRDWKEGRFPKVPGETEFIPLPRSDRRRGQDDDPCRLQLICRRCRPDLRRLGPKMGIWTLR